MTMPTFCSPCDTQSNMTFRDIATIVEKDWSEPLIGDLARIMHGGWRVWFK